MVKEDERMVRNMEAFFTETTRLRDSIDNDNVPERYGGVESMANEELLATDPPPFSWKELMALLEQQRIVWLNSQVFLLRDRDSGCLDEFDDWVVQGGYERFFSLGHTDKEDYIALYALDEEPQTAQPTTTACNFLVDLFCLGGGDSAFLFGSRDDSDDDVLSHFISKRSEDVASLRKLQLENVLFTEASCRALATLSEAADSHFEIDLQECDIPSNVGDVYLSFLQQSHGPTTLIFCELSLRVLSQGLRANAQLRSVALNLSSLSRSATSSIEESMTELAQSLSENEGLERLQVDEDTGDSAASEECLRILCEGLTTHPTLRQLYLENFFLMTIPLSLEDQKQRARYIQQLLKSSTVLENVFVGDEEEEEPFYNEFLRPHIEINRNRNRFLSVRNAPLQDKLLAPAVAKLADWDEVHLMYFFLTVNREALVNTVGHVVAPLTRVTGRVHARPHED